MTIWTYVIIGISIGVVLLLCFALAIASFSFDNYAEKLKKLEKMRNTYGITTLEYVKNINQRHFGGRIRLAQCPEWQDHYSSGMVALSQKTMQSNSLASLAIVSHELGHARQDATGNSLNKQYRMRRSNKIFGFFFLPLLLAGIVLALLWVFEVFENNLFIFLGAACFGLAIFIFLFAIVMKYREIKIEREASDFALEFLQEFLTEPEVKMCQEFLNSARLTYWASLIRTMLSWTFLTKNDK